jgi:hypothetical protein
LENKSLFETMRNDVRCAWMFKRNDDAATTIITDGGITPIAQPDTN